MNSYLHSPADLHTSLHSQLKKRFQILIIYTPAALLDSLNYDCDDVRRRDIYLADMDVPLRFFWYQHYVASARPIEASAGLHQRVDVGDGRRRE